MVSTAETLRALGRRVPRDEAAAERTARDLVRQGMPVGVIDRLAKAFGTSIAEVQRLVGVSRATGTRRRAGNAPLRQGASDRAFRLAGVFALATKVFEDEAAARDWFKERNRALQGERPIDLLDTEVGTQQVVRVLERIEHGVYS